MAQTNTSNIQAKVNGAALFAQVQKASGTMRSLVGAKPTEMDVEGKLGKQQSSPGMPIVEINDLTKTAGGSASIDCIDISTQKPIMGDKQAEGKGVPLSFTNMDISINQWTFPVSAGGRMAQQRVIHDLRKMARATAVGLASRYYEQRTLVHLAGARGSVNTQDWIIPLASDADFNEIMTNTVRAPTYNRHYVVSGNNIVQGGQQLGAIASTDTLKLTHLDQIRNVIDNLDLSIQTVKIADDPAAGDDPMWCMLVPSNVYSALLQEGSLRAFQQNAVNRAAYGSKHPLFRGEVGMWNGILVKKIQRTIRFAASESVQIVTSANAATATETAQVVNAGIGAGFAVERCVLLGAQALANAYGKDSKSGTHYSWAEKYQNFDREPEFAVFGIEGSAKVRFSVPDGAGGRVMTDHGAMVLDVAARQSV